AEKLRELRLLSDTLPTRAVPPEFGHSLRRHTWNASLFARSTPTVASLIIQASGRQLLLMLPVKRWRSFVVTYCMIQPGAKEFAACSGKPVGSVSSLPSAPVMPQPVFSVPLGQPFHPKPDCCT